jgi:hypothetical protein
MEISNELKNNLIADVENICAVTLDEETKTALMRCFEITIGTRKPALSHVTFIGELPKNRFYQVLEKIDAMKRMGYVFSKHERKDSDGYVNFDYELELHYL